MAAADADAGAAEGFADAAADAVPGLCVSDDPVEVPAEGLFVADADVALWAVDPPGLAVPVEAPPEDAGPAEEDAPEAGVEPAGLAADDAPDAPDPGAFEADAVDAPEADAEAAAAGFDAEADVAPGLASPGFVSAVLVSGVLVSAGFDAAEAVGPPVAGFCAAALAPGTSLASRSMVTGLRPDAGPEPALLAVFAESLFWSGFLLSAAMTVLSPAGRRPGVYP